MPAKSSRDRVVGLVCLLWAVGFPFFAAAAPSLDPEGRVKVAPAPEWALSAALPSARGERIEETQDGVYYLILDSQSLVEADHYVRFRRRALQVVNRAGLEDAGRLEFEFDPTEDALTIHAINVRRDGETIDRLTGASAIIARRESEMSQGVTDGALTAYIEIPDVRVGDIIDYAFSWRVNSQLWPGEFTETATLRWSTPLSYRRVRVLIDEDRELTIANRNVDVEPRISDVGSRRDYVWEVIDPDPVDGQASTPETWRTWGEVSISTFPDWAAVAAKLTPYYEAASHLPDEMDGDLPSIMDEGALEARITAAIRYVQDDIRYVSDSTGLGSHLPRTPAETVARGWGDCKDKSVLLAAMLRRMGVDATVALTNLEGGADTPNRTPSPYAFDHAIVVVEYEGRRVWIDATSYAQGGVFPKLATPAYGFALPLKPGSGELWPIAVPVSGSPNKHVAETFDFGRRGEGPIGLEVVTRLRDREADRFRRDLQQSSASQFSETYLEYYSKHYPGLIVTTPIDVADDRDENVIVVTERYQLPLSAYENADIASSFPLRADGVLSLIEEVDLSDRVAPISLPYPVDAIHEVRMLNVDAGASDARVEAESDALKYVRSEIVENDRLTMSYRLQTFADQISVKDGETLNAAARDLEDWGSFEFTFDADDTSEDSFLFWALALFAAVAVLILPFGIIDAFRSDKKTDADAVLHPVSLQKFIVLTIVTFGLYSSFWMWRTWARVAKDASLSTPPFVMALFAPLTYFVLFDRIRSRQAPPQTSNWFGGALAAAYLMGIAIPTIASEFIEKRSLYAGFAILELAALLLTVPLLQMVNRMNASSSPAYIENSRVRLRTIGAVVVGVSYWGLAIAAFFVLPE